MPQNISIYIVVGAARSGTTFLASLLKSDDIHYIEEPNFIWRYRNPTQKDDCLQPHMLTDEIIGYIRSWFDASLGRSQTKKCILEKTPANCLRLPYIQTVFPEAKYIFLQREIQDIANSAERKWLHEEDGNTRQLYDDAIPHKVRHLSTVVRRLNEIPIRDLVFYIPRFTSEILFFLGLRKRSLWGPRYKDMASDMTSLSLSQVVLKQARESNKCLEEFRKTLSANEFISLRYEDMVEDQQGTKELVHEFMGL